MEINIKFSLICTLIFDVLFIFYGWCVLSDPTVVRNILSNEIALMMPYFLSILAWLSTTYFIIHIGKS